jgi:hypothetical protein
MLSALAAALLLLAPTDDPAPAPKAADAPAPIEAEDALERLKALAGRWECGFDGQPAGVFTYTVVAEGSALVETLFDGTPHEMVSVYFLDGDDLVMTHYCAAKNQPRFKLDRAASDAGTLRFAFDGGTNLDPAKDMHMHEGVVRLESKDEVRAEWTGYAGGKPVGTHEFLLKRK